MRYQIAWIAIVSWMAFPQLLLLAQPTAPSKWERIPENEPAQIQHVVELTQTQLRNRYGGQAAIKRGVHAKDHGCVKAEFQVVSDLDPEDRVGIFTEPGKKYDAWVRFSNAATLVLPDDIPDKTGKPIPGSRGMAIKVLGVQGDPLLPLHGALTQDFLLVNHPVFAFPNVEDYEVLSSVLADPANMERPDQFFVKQMKKGGAAKIRAERTKEIVDKIRATDANAFQPQPKSPVDCRYFSGAPFTFGDDAVIKYAAFPVDPDQELPSNTSEPNYLRQALKKRLELREGNRPVVFLFQIQKRDPRKLDLEKDIENACTEWTEQDTHFVSVAKLTIQPQDFDEPSRVAAM